MDVKWIEVPLPHLVSDRGWKRDDPVVFAKLVSSVRRHGQLRALVVRESAEDGRLHVVDGRLLARALAAAGKESASAIHVGRLDAVAASRLALALGLAFEIDYAALAAGVHALIQQGVSANELSGHCMFSAERLTDMAMLATFDWSRFDVPEESQHVMSWDDFGLAADEAVDSEVTEMIVAAVEEEPVAEELEAPEPEVHAPATVVQVQARPTTRRRKPPSTEERDLFDQQLAMF